jgi:predicted small secreted protein
MAKKIVIILVLLSLVLSGCASQNGIGQSNKDLSGALNLVLGTTDEPSVFNSYHIELVLDTPVLSDDNTTIVNELTQISADVQGANVHILQIDPGETTQKEGYIIGDTEYKLVNGAKEDTMGFIALAWAMWPIQVILPYAWAANWNTKTGTETLDGREADVYTFDSTSAPESVQSGLSAYGMTGTLTANGTVWVDRETGAMLKLDMVYVTSLTDSDGKAVGNGNGHVTIDISGVNQTTVVEP